MTPTTALVSVITGIIVGFVSYNAGQIDVHFRDHIQVKAGVFIDGYDKNKIYRICP